MATGRGVPRRERATLPAGGGPRRSVPPIWREIGLVLFGYWVYTLVRNAVPDQERVAIRRAGDIYRLEQAAGIDIELAVNQAIDRISWLIVGMNYYYAVAHFAVTTVVLVWLYRRHSRQYRPARTVFLVTNCFALAGFYLYALAPPRLLPEYGYIDTVVTHGTWGSWASGDVAAATNQYAAMPSMHVAWSLWCAIMIFTVARRPWVRALGILHVLATLVVIVATANHFLLDAVGGAAALGCAYALVWAFGLLRNRWPTRPRTVSAEPAPA